MFRTLSLLHLTREVRPPCHFFPVSVLWHAVIGFRHRHRSKRTRTRWTLLRPEDGAVSIPPRTTHTRPGAGAGIIPPPYVFPFFYLFLHGWTRHGHKPSGRLLHFSSCKVLAVRSGIAPGRLPFKLPELTGWWLPFLMGVGWLAWLAGNESII